MSLGVKKKPLTEQRLRTLWWYCMIMETRRLGSKSIPSTLYFCCTSDPRVVQEVRRKKSSRQYNKLETDQEGLDAVFCQSVRLRRRCQIAISLEYRTENFATYNSADFYICQRTWEYHTTKAEERHQLRRNASTSTCKLPSQIQLRLTYGK
jgi:hypothetical protein